MQCALFSPGLPENPPAPHKAEQLRIVCEFLVPLRNTA